MKKLLSVVLAIAVLTTLACSAMATASAADGSLLPAKAEDFTIVKGGSTGNESMTIKKLDKGFEFVGDAGGWPQAYYSNPDEPSWPKADTNDANLYLNWDFEVKSGGANICVYFAGQSPKDQPSEGAAETINYYINSANNKLSSNAVADLPVGTYKGSIHVKDTGISELLMEEGVYYISGVKVFAVGGTVVVNDIWVGPKAEGSTEANTATTTKAADTATTTAAKTTATNASTPSSAKTGDVSNAVLFIVVAAVAAGVVTLSVVSKKKKN